jgi:YidC/Oxa1 family membrane protein insertase
MIDEDKIHAQIQENKTKIKAKSKWQIRMEEMMKQQQEMQKKRK